MTGGGGKIGDTHSSNLDLKNADIENGFEWLVLKRRSQRQRRIRFASK
jgi:hypothetical protein